MAGTEAAVLNPSSLPFFPTMGGIENGLAASPGPVPIAPGPLRAASSSSSAGSDYRSIISTPSPQPPDFGIFRSGGGAGTVTPVGIGQHPSFPITSSLSTATTSSLRSTTSTMLSDAMASSSPTSSSGSHGPLGPGPQRDTGALADPAAQFDASLLSSRVIKEVFERLVRCEISVKDMHRELSEVNRKLNVLIDRSIANTVANSVNNAPTVPPPPPPQETLQFRNPFAASAPIITPLPINGPPGLPLSNGMPPARGPPPRDDITQMAQQISSLNSSVSQLLALQTQQAQQHRGSIGMMPPQGMDQMPPAPGIPPAGNGNRQAQRVANLPGRTWSQGSLDMRPPPPDGPMIHGRGGDPRNGGGAKRGSVAGLLRRESSGMLDSSGEWSNSSRDNGPAVSKWESLPIVPDLLRSIAKYGVGPPNKIQQRALPFLLRGSDIIAQAPPTQERIAAYVIPAIQMTLNLLASKPVVIRGPVAVIISTTVDQATQAQRMIRDLGGPIGVRSALGVGSSVGSNEVANEVRQLQQNVPHIICGTPQKLHAMFTNSQPLPAGDVRLLVLDEVDQLIARNLHEFVFGIVKLLPPPRSRPLPSSGSSPSPSNQMPFSSNSFEPSTSPSVPFAGPPRRFASGVISPGPGDSPTSSLPPVGSTPPSSGFGTSSTPPPVERQTALFSNTVPQDVLNLANAIQLREPVRVLVRRDGNVTQADTTNGARGLRQFYLYLAFTAGGGRVDGAAPSNGGLGIIGSGRGTSSAETAQAREWKLEALADLFDDVEVSQAIVHVGGMNSLDSVVYKLASRGIDAVPLHSDMASGAKMAALNKFRTNNPVLMRQPVTKVLVVYDVQVKSPDVFQVPLVINYDLPKAVEEYAHRVAPAISSTYSRAGVVVNFVTATGGDVEMLRSIECFYKIKCPEVPMSLRDVI